MKKTVYSPPCLAACQRRRRLFAAVLLGGFMFAGSQAQEVLLKEDFNTDGGGTRYTIEGGGVSEQADHANNGVAVDQTGPVYWALSSEVSIIGVPGPTPARRIIMAWDSAIPADQIGPDFFKLFDSVVKWATKDKAKLTVLLSPAGVAPSLAAHLEAAGHTIVDDDASIPAEQVVADLILRGNGAADSSRLANAAVPMIAFSATDADDLLISTIGATASFEPGNANIVAAAHPAAGGLTGPLKIATGTYNWEMVGDLLPIGATTLATMERVQAPTAASLADVDGMISGAKQSNKASDSSFTELDIGDGAPGDFPLDWFPPGGLTGVWGLQATGKIAVSTTGTYSFAVNTDDGARLRIDADKNGFTDADTVAGGDGVATYYGDKQLAAGTYDYQVVAYNSGGAGVLEVSVSLQAGGGDTSPVAGGNWDLLGASTGAVKLSGPITYTSYEPSGPPDTTNIPFIVLINGGDEGGSVYGGGPFGNFEGSAFFGGAALNKFTGDDGVGNPKVLTLKPVDVTGKSNLHLSVLASATYLDFETSDYLDFKVGEAGADPSTFKTLIRFTAPTGTDKFFDNRGTQPGNVTQLGLAAQDITVDIPSGYKSLVVRVEAVTTWWNEIVAFDNIRVTSGAIAPPPPAAPQALLVVGTGSVPNLNASDAGVKALLESMGFMVTVANAPASTTADADGKSLIVTSSTVNSGDVAEKFQMAAVPVVNWEQAVQDNYLMTGNEATDHSTIADQTTLQLVNSTHALSAGLPRGVITAATSPQAWSWGLPSAGAITIAHVAGNPAQAVVYGYEAGAMMFGGAVAPARRVMLFGGDDTYAAATPEGKALYSAAIRWAAGLPAAPIGQSISLGLNFGADEPDGSNGFSLAPTDEAGAPGLVQANWNNLTTLTGAAASGLMANIAGAAIPTGVSVEWSSNNTWASTGRGEPNGDNFKPGTADAKLMGGYLDTGDPTLTTVKISGIPGELAGGGYDVIVYTSGGVASGRSGAYRIVDAATGAALTDYVRATSFTSPTDYVQVSTNLPDGEYGPGTHIVFEGITAQNITIEGSTEAGLGAGSPARAPINAVQLVAPAANPPPSKGSVVFVSFHDTEAPDATAAGVGLTEASDKGYTDLLKVNGYTVTRFLTANDVDVSTLPPADLIIIGRAVSSGNYQQANETVAWNGISKPVMILGGYILRNSRLGFTAGGTMVDTVGDVKLTVTDPSHPIFAGIALDANNTMANVYAGIESFVGQDPPIVQRGISVNTDAAAGNGTVLASIATAEDPAVGGLIIGEWKAGSVMSNGSADVLGGDRIVFLTGSREADGFTGGNAAGFYDLEPDGQKMFLNAVAYAVGLGAGGAGASITGIRLNGGSISIEWTGGGTLEQAGNIEGPWAAVTGATSPYTAQANGPGAFFRVRQ